MIQQANAGQFLLSQNLQGQMQLVASSQAGQYVIQAGGQQGAYVVAQPQTTMVHGQPQTVLLAQTSQQQGTSAKTIIILQQQPPPSTSATHHQKVSITEIYVNSYWKLIEVSFLLRQLLALRELLQRCKLFSKNHYFNNGLKRIRGL